MRRKRVDASLWILLGLLIVAAGYAFARDRHLPLDGLFATARLLRGVWIELLLGFLLAGLVDVLIPADALVRWLGSERPMRGIAVGWVVGLAIPGGPYLLFPIVANLFGKGVAAGPLIALVSAKTLISPIRMLTYEAPLLGWPLTLARLLPALAVPPLLGLVGQWIYDALRAKG
ncbi:MAG TPA: permease [Polyangia bacterium]|jgi:uncharacterized membrane protein YraQ (UPF0718 family)|nr:permease [Polyangia bacterium]